MNSSVDVRESFVVAGSSSFMPLLLHSHQLILSDCQNHILLLIIQNNFVEKALTAVVHDDGVSFIYTDADHQNIKSTLLLQPLVQEGDVANSTYALIKTNVTDTYNAGDDISGLTTGSYVAFAEHVDGNTYLMPSEIVSITVS